VKQIWVHLKLTCSMSERSTASSDESTCKLLQSLGSGNLASYEFRKNGAKDANRSVFNRWTLAKEYLSSKQTAPINQARKLMSFFHTSNKDTSSIHQTKTHIPYIKTRTRPLQNKDTSSIHQNKTFSIRRTILLLHLDFCVLCNRSN
jgi:hypothetical protein